MKKSQIYILSAALVAVVAIIVGICLFFFANPVITDIPGSLHIENVSGDFFLVAEFDENYKYQFRLEQKTGENEFTLVKTVNSNTNSINLKESGLDIIAGNTYRFSACYATDSGAGNGKFGEYLPWQPKLTLSAVPTESILFDETQLSLSWQKVAFATDYIVKIQAYDGSTPALNYSSNQQTTLSLKDKVAQFGVGRFKVYVFANSSDIDYLPSPASDEKQIEIKQKNKILSVSRVADGLDVECSLCPKEIQVLCDGVLKATLRPDKVKQLGVTYVLTFDDVDFILNALDGKIEFVSVGEEYVLESDPYSFN